MGRLKLTLNDSQRSHSDNGSSQAGLLCDPHHVGNVLVGDGCLFGQRGPVVADGNDTLFGKLLLDVAAL